VTTVTSYPPDGVEVLDFVGAGVGLGAGVGDFDGGASVGLGAGCGADDVGPGAGRELCEPPPALVLGAGEPALPPEGDTDGWPEARADPDGDGLPARVLAVDCAPEPDAPWPAVDCEPVEVPASLCAAVLANKVVIPNAVTRLSSVARQVSRDRRRSPVSRLALRFRCLMAVTPPGLGLRAHQDRPSGLLR
jgi:hypothetical protein